ncbi:MAG: UDP-N-acetylmuramate dehydrogenase [Chlorobiaceae bacterium]|nr:UDP-N-acetylmuramate dehydrogenase [Chlorobiaceae bacterium]
MQDRKFPCHIDQDVPLSEKAYYAIGGRSMAVAYPRSLSELSALLLWNRKKRFPLALMGSGSNILFSDEPFPGIVISFERMARMFWMSGTDLFCEAGTVNTRIAEELLQRGRTGGEWLYRLPGQVGSTVRMNARCFGGEISSVTTGISALHADGRLIWHTPEEVFQGYKQTALMESPEIVAGVLLRFPEKRPPDEIKELMLQYEGEREAKHHFDFPSCGSTFKNNYAAGRSSGKIFDELGFRGQREGGASVSDHHANFIFNRGRATSRDVLELAGRMRSAALENAGVPLDLEVQCIGRFDRSLLEKCGVPFDADQHDESFGWAGLWWMPEKDIPVPSAEYPRKLAEGPLSGYFGRDAEYPPGVFVSVEQLLPLEDAALEPEKPFLRWTTLPGDDEAFTVLPPFSSEEMDFVDGLWRYSVSELFLARSDGQGGYLEFEMTPEGHWVALRFRAPREREEGFVTLLAEPWEQDVLRFNDEGRFGMEYSYRLIEPFIDGDCIAIQCCASTGRNSYGLFPAWPETKEPADFHQPAEFFRARLS